jgi:hypothetical protein
MTADFLTQGRIEQKILGGRSQSTHRVATATVWRTVHHDRKICPGWKGWGAPPPPFTISTITYEVVAYAPAERADTIPLFLLYPYCGDDSDHEMNLTGEWRIDYV